MQYRVIACNGKESEKEYTYIYIYAAAAAKSLQSYLTL